MRAFLSFHSPDRERALALKVAIEKALPGAEIFVDQTDLRFGHFWQPALSDAIAKSAAFITLVSNQLGDWQKLEYYEARDRKAKDESYVLLPIITAEKARGPAANLPGLAQLHWIETTEPTAPEPLGRIVAALACKEVPKPPEPWRIINPYRGLLALEEQDADFFFGRNHEAAGILETLIRGAGRLIALIGNSGVGKSSLVQAGIIGSLKRQRWPGDGQAWPAVLKDSRAWAFLSMRPGENPIDALASAFASLWFPDATDPVRIARRRRWVTALRSGEATLSDLIEITDERFKIELGLSPPRRLLLYIDQGEELYSRVRKDEIKLFSELIANGLSHPRLLIITSLRSDYYGQLQASEQLFPLTERIDVPPLGAEALKAVLREPARALSVKFESDNLVEQIVVSAQDQPGALPLLADLFTDLWERMQIRGDGTLRVADRKEIIQVGAALSRRADEFLAGHPAQIEDVKRLFTLRLAHVPRLGEPVRRQTVRTPERETEWQLAEMLAGPDWRLLVTGENDKGEATVEVAHEVLFKTWPALRQWLVQERDFLIWRDEVEARRQQFEDAHEKSEALLMGLPLTQAVQWLRVRRADIDRAEQKYIETSEQREQTRKRYRNALAAAAFAVVTSFAVVAAINWNEARTAEKEAIAQTQQVEKAKSELARQTSQLSVAADGYRSQIAANRDLVAGRLDQALDEAKAAMKTFADLVASAPSVLVWQHDLAGSYSLLGDVMLAKDDRDAASRSYRNSIEVYERTMISLPGNNPTWQRDLAITYNKLGDILLDAAQYQGAFENYQHSLAVLERTVSPEDPLVATTLDKFADTYRAQGMYPEAEPLLRRSLSLREKLLSADHPDVGQSLDRIAQLLAMEGRYAEAEPLVQRAIGIREKAFGSAHLEVGQSLNTLADLYQVQGRYPDANRLYRRSLAIFEKSLGPEHLLVAAVLSSLAQLYLAQGRDAEADPLLKRSLAIREKLLGANHPDVAQSLNNLATLYMNQTQYADAEPLYKRALAIYKNALGSDHPAVARVLNSLAELYDRQGRYADAEPLLKESLTIRERALGSDHPDVAQSLNNLATLYLNQKRYVDAEPLYQRSLAIRKKAFGPDHPDVAKILNNLAALYSDQGRYGDALPLVRRTIADRTAAASVALPVLFRARTAKLISTGEALEDSLNVLQRASRASASEALDALGLRYSVGNSSLADMVRREQDLAVEAASLERTIDDAVSQEPSRRDAGVEQKIRDRLAAVEKVRRDLAETLAEKFPSYEGLLRPEPLMVKQIQEILAEDEVLVIVYLGDKRSYVWAITSSRIDWKELAVTGKDISERVSVLRRPLSNEGFSDNKPFDAQASFDLYQKILVPVADVLQAKPRLSVVLNGALTDLPLQLLVTRDPTGQALKNVDWLVRTHAIAVLPSIASLKVLRRVSTDRRAKKPFIGFADPAFDVKPPRADPSQADANIGDARDGVADLRTLRALPRLPETADELRQVAASVKADPADILVGADATETRVKRTNLEQYRIVYFSTHSLLAGEVAEFARLRAEPALVLSLPAEPTEFDDGLLTESEISQLKLDADWVVLAAANTAAGEKPGAEALSGLARAFFYAGARSLVVSSWSIESESAVALTTGIFAALAAEPKLSHAEALQKSMLAMIRDGRHPEWADPKYWAPFAVVGEPSKPTN